MVMARYNDNECAFTFTCYLTSIGSSQEEAFMVKLTGKHGFGLRSQC